MSEHDRLSILNDDHDDDQNDSTFDDSPSPRPRRRRWVIPVAVLGVLVLGIAAAAGFYISRLNRAVAEIPREDYMPPRASGQPQAPSSTPTTSGQKGINYVLLGSDSRAGETGRSDSLIVAHVSENRQRVHLISFPRDMWVDIPGRDKGKINWAYAFGGPPLTVQTLEQLLKVRMDHTAVVDFTGFVQLADALGGVDVYNKQSFSIGGEHFAEGMVHLEGERTLLFVRERKSLANGDLDRAENQRAVVQAILAKASRPDTLANPIAFDRLLTGASRAVKVDKGLTDAEIRNTALSMRITQNGDIVSMQAPMTGFGWAGDQAVAVVDEKQMAEMANALREDRLDDYLTRFPKSCTGPTC
ncbi:LCP family protein [Mariniluteicoccus flavus]